MTPERKSSIPLFTSESARPSVSVHDCRQRFCCREVCGYPYTVHGGLTAAIVDETFGGLMFNIWRSGDLGFSLPAVTARLEVDYCNRLPQNSVVRCRTKLEELGKREGRSFWMEAELCDQSGAITYATARACFVSPSWSRSAIKWIKGITGN